MVKTHGAKLNFIVLFFIILISGYFAFGTPVDHSDVIKRDEFTTEQLIRGASVSPSPATAHIIQSVCNTGPQNSAQRVSGRTIQSLDQISCTCNGTLIECTNKKCAHVTSSSLDCAQNSQRSTYDALCSATHENGVYCF